MPPALNHARVRLLILPVSAHFAISEMAHAAGEYVETGKITKCETRLRDWLAP
jgi:hypothetical protein